MKRIGLYFSLFVFTLISCQKETVQPKSDTDEKIKEIENLFGAKLIENASEDEIKNSIFIPYDQIKEYIDNYGSPLSRNDNDMHREFTRDVEFRVTNEGLKTTIKNITISLKGTIFSFDYDINLMKSVNYKWNEIKSIDFVGLKALYNGNTFKCSTDVKK